MDNPTMPAPVIKHAITCWQVLNGLAVSAAAYQESMLFVYGEHTGNISDRTGINITEPTNYARQPEAPKLIKKWRPKFEPQSQLTEVTALNFIIEVVSSMEMVDEFMGQHSRSGVTKMEYGSPNDTITHRPAGSMHGWSLNLSVSGVGHYNCIRQEVFAGPGEMILLSPEAIYDYRRAEHSDNWTHYWIYFQPNQRLLDWLNWAEVGPHSYHLQLPKKEYTGIKKLFESTLEFDPTADGTSSALFTNITEQIFIRSSRFSVGNERGVSDPRVKKTIDYIISNLEKPLTVQDIAHHVRLSKTQLSTLFKAVTGSTLINWREERRITKATQLLTQTSLQVQEIAESLGYDDPLYFSRTFSKLVGCSPRKYRKEH